GTESLGTIRRRQTSANSGRTHSVTRDGFVCRICFSSRVAIPVASMNTGLPSESGANVRQCMPSKMTRCSDRHHTTFLIAIRAGDYWTSKLDLALGRLSEIWMYLHQSLRARIGWFRRGRRLDG